MSKLSSQADAARNRLASAERQLTAAKAVTDAGGKGPDQVMLTNQNMLGQEADESVFDLKELMPKGALKDAPTRPSGTPVPGTSL